MEPAREASLVDRLNRPLRWPAAGRWLRDFAAQARWAVTRPSAPVFAFIAFLLLAISRRSDLVTRGQFYAEDGALFFADAQQRGLLALGEAYNGYLHVLPRLLATLASWVPLEDAPSTLNLLSLCVSAGTATYVAFRLGHVRWVERFLLAAALVAVPRVYEMFGNAANLQWFLAALGCAMVGARPPKTERVRWMDRVLAVVVGLSSPLAGLLAMFAAFRWWRERGPWPRELFMLFGVAAAVQAGAMLLHPRESHVTAGFASDVLVRVMYAQFAGPLFGSAQFFRLSESTGVWLPRLAVLSVAFGFLAHGLWRGPAYLKGLIVMGAAVAVLGVLRPLRDGSLSEFVFDHLRYFYLLHAAVLASAVWTVARLLRERRRGAVALAALTVLLLGPNLLRAWTLTPSRDLGHRRQVEAARLSGLKEVELWILPSGWRARLRL